MQMFKNCYSLTSIPDNFILNYPSNTGYNLSDMFYNCSSLISANFSLPSTAYDISNMFYNCLNLK
jgi:hypothetical protein